jgi:hypothetical protein
LAVDEQLQARAPSVPMMLALPLLRAQMSCRPAAAPLDDKVQGIWLCCRGNLPLPPSAVVKLASVKIPPAAM